MADFKASKRLSKLNYDFDDFAPDHLRPMRGQVPEPSRQAVIAFNDALAKGLESIGKAPADPTDRIAVARAFSLLTVEEQYKIDDHVVSAIMALTENNPPRDQFEQLGSRAQMVYREWLQEECNRPEAPTPATPSS